MNAMHLSFEYFPPKTDAGMEKLINTTNQLKPLNPEFFSVTYGAGGTSQNRTLDTVEMLQKKCKVIAAAHISCIGSTKEKIRMLLTQYQNAGIKRLVALRGDLPSGMMGLDNDFQYAYQLIEFIRKETGDFFYIEAAAYPEMHPETLDPTQSIQHLKMKVDAGANRLITQYFYNADAYFYLLEAAHKAGITVPIIPGIMPITNYTQLARFSQMCGADIPRWLRMHLEPIKDDLSAVSALGIEFMTSLCGQLIEADAPGLHFYTLNKAAASIEIIKRLRLAVKI
jgi:methylenetetrahydrofolate reductase (NADPH)